MERPIAKVRAGRMWLIVPSSCESHHTSVAPPSHNVFDFHTSSALVADLKGILPTFLQLLFCHHLISGLLLVDNHLISGCGLPSTSSEPTTLTARHVSTQGNSCRCCFSCTEQLRPVNDAPQQRQNKPIRDGSENAFLSGSQVLTSTSYVVSKRLQSHTPLSDITNSIHTSQETMAGSRPCYNLDLHTCRASDSFYTAESTAFLGVQAPATVTQQARLCPETDFRWRDCDEDDDVHGEPTL